MPYFYITLKISELDIDPKMQSRGGTDAETVSQYAEAMKGGDKFPPVDACRIDGRYCLVDGFHRIEALILARFDVVEVKYFEGSLRDAFIASLGMNAKHGKTRTNKEKRETTKRALADEELAMKSNREIATICGVSPQLVSELREQLQEAASPTSLAPPMNSINVASPDPEVNAIEANPPTVEPGDVSRPTGEKWACESGEEGPAGAEWPAQDWAQLNEATQRLVTALLQLTPTARLHRILRSTPSPRSSTVYKELMNESWRLARAAEDEVNFSARWGAQELALRDLQAGRNSPEVEWFISEGVEINRLRDDAAP